MGTSVIREPDGTVVFEMKDIEFQTMVAVATDIIAKIFSRRRPQYHKDGSPKLQSDGSRAWV